MFVWLLGPEFRTIWRAFELPYLNWIWTHGAPKTKQMCECERSVAQTIFPQKLTFLWCSDLCSICVCVFGNTFYDLWLPGDTLPTAKRFIAHLLCSWFLSESSFCPPRRFGGRETRKKQPDGFPERCAWSTSPFLGDIRNLMNMNIGCLRCLAKSK